MDIVLEVKNTCSVSRTRGRDSICFLLKKSKVAHGQHRFKVQRTKPSQVRKKSEKRLRWKSARNLQRKSLGIQ